MSGPLSKNSYIKALLAKLLLLVVLASPELLIAQTREGQVISDALSLGWGKSAPLPEGKWLLKKKDSLPLIFSGQNANHVGYLLENLNKEDDIQYVLVQESRTPYGWTSNASFATPSKAIDIQRYSTTNSSFITKISYVQLSSDITPEEYSSNAFKSLGIDLKNLPNKLSSEYVMTNIRILNKTDAIWYRALIKLPPNKSENLDASLSYVSTYNGRLMESIFFAYNDKKPQEPLFFSFSGHSQGEVKVAGNKLEEESQAASKLADQKRLAEEAKVQPAKVNVTPSQPSKADQLAQLQLQMAALKADIEKGEPPKTQTAVITTARRALVIGNNKYSNVSALENAADDAIAMAESLRTLSFDVTVKTDLSLKDMNAAIRNFKGSIKKGDEVVFFYAGHGVQIGQSNFLLPVDITGESEDQIRDDAVLLDRVLDDISEKKAKFTLAMLDACRDNPFKKAGRSLGGVTRGLAPASTANGQMIIFSAGAGQQALDKLGPNDKEKNGLFTRVFIKEMQKSGLSVDRVVRNVRNQVVDLAKSVKHDQVPAIYDQVIGEFYFKP
jgi:hypothetical protein